MPIINIHKVNRKNFAELLFLIKELALYEKMDPPNNAALKRLEDDYFKDKPLFEAYIAEDDNKPVGYIIIEMIYSTFLAYPTIYLEDFFVLQDKRRRGVGQALFNFTVKLAKERKCGRIEWTALNWNKVARNFYKKNRVEPMEEWHFYRMHKNQIDSFKI